MAANPRAVAKAIARQNTPSNAPVGGGGFGGAPSTLPSGQMSPLVASYDAWMSGRGTSVGLPRSWESFLSGSFGPLMPIQPVPIDEPPPGSERPEPRRWQYQVGWNMPMGPPGSEGLKLATFPQLRTIADTYSVARACIEVRKAELLGLEWDIIPTKAAEKKLRGDKNGRREWDERRAKVMKFFRKPDPNYFSFASWWNAQLEDVLAVDALTLYLHPSRMAGKGVVNSNLAAFEVIDGTTIRPMVDMQGAKPPPPNPAYQQYIYGVPRVDLMTMMTGEDIAEMGDAKYREYSGDQLLYLPYDARDWTPYGFAPVEKALVPILSGLNRQNWQLQYFSEGTIPGLFITGGDPNATPQQLRELQDALNAMAGDPAWKHKIIVLPQGSQAMPQTPAELAGTFDEIVMTQVCMAFDVMPMELGISPRTSHSQSAGAANQMAKTSRDVFDRKANGPLCRRFMEIFDHVIQIVLAQDDMRFMFEGLEGGEDEETLVNRLVNEISHGLKSIDEARIERGEQPWGVPIASDPVWATATGLLPIGSLDPKTGQPPAPPLPPGMPQLPPGPGGAPRPAASRRAVAAAPAGTPAHAGAASHDAVMGQQSSGVAAKMNTFAALHELDLMRRRLAKGRTLDGWKAEHVPAALAATLTDLPSIDRARRIVKATADDDQPASEPPPQPDNRWPAWALDTLLATLVAHHLAEAFLPGTDLDTLARAFTKWAAGRKVNAEQIRVWLEQQNLGIDDDLTPALTDALTEGYAMGHMAANAVLAHGDVRNAAGGRVDVDWHGWQPGDADAARAVLGDSAGLGALLDKAGITIDGITGSRLDQLARILADGIANGDPPAKIARALRALKDDPGWAMTVAWTETNRAMSAAALDTYKAEGVERKEWLTAHDQMVCFRCLGNEEQGAILIEAPFLSGDEAPPGHPRCRCAPIPAP